MDYEKKIKNALNSDLKHRKEKKYDRQREIRSNNSRD